MLKVVPVSLLLLLLTLAFSASASASGSFARPTVKVENLTSIARENDEVSAAYRGSRLLVIIRHRRGIGHAKLILDNLRRKSIRLDVRFLDFAMLEGFTIGSGSKQIFELSDSRSERRKFTLPIVLSSSSEKSASVDLSWVDAYR
ncbi:MAG: hypothetical protein WCT03_07030 [Candidatus Obscuribacterales bacterium]|jgi:hypothetical protein